MLCSTTKRFSDHVKHLMVQPTAIFFFYLLCGAWRQFFSNTKHIGTCYFLMGWALVIYLNFRHFILTKMLVRWYLLNLYALYTYWKVGHLLLTKMLGTCYFPKCWAFLIYSIYRRVILSIYRLTVESIWHKAAGRVR